MSSVNKREVREHWLPLRGNLMLGMSHTVLQGKTQDYEYLRIESRPDGVYYVALPSGQNPTSFKFEGKTVVTMGDRSDDAFVFTNPALEFPQICDRVLNMLQRIVCAVGRPHWSFEHFGISSGLCSLDREARGRNRS